ncbi:MAG TPA: type IV pilus twitching motility protein PilT [Planctomycetota bacterium]|nr:type IV pilus twitching motility protein PilT [Planctomycetota bacterium]
MVTLEELLRVMIERGSSDLHITAGSPPRIRVDGKLNPTEHEMLDAEWSQRLAYSILDNDQIAKFERDLELDMSFGIAGIGRFRTNVFMQRGAVGMAIRVIPYEIASFETLGLPQVVCQKLCDLPKGLVLVTGATGSGKSTTLAAMIDNINTYQPVHIVTIEDPIEFVHRNKTSLVNQREVGPDTKGFSEALRHVLRQDPDVVLIGEMRDQETMEAGLTLAETGHLTFATLHTSDCVQTINRIIDAFPTGQQNQIRTQLSFVLEGVFCQQLLPVANGKGRVLAAEIMLPNEAIRALIREDKAHQIQSSIQVGGNVGMRTMNQSLFELYKRGQITYEDAIHHTSDPEDLKRTFQRAVPGPGGR